MKKLVVYQLLILVAAVFIFFIFQGTHAALSALFGGLCYYVPNLIMVLILNFFNKNPAWMFVKFIVGEGLKIILVLILMLGVFTLYPSTQWIPFFIGLLLVSHFIFFVFWKLNNHGN